MALKQNELMSDIKLNDISNQQNFLVPVKQDTNFKDYQTFTNEEFGNVRVIGDVTNPLFCLADVCKVLELTVKGVVQRLDKEVISTYPLRTAGGIQQMYFVNESGLYDVVLDSRKSSAKKFRKWITEEVLPSIRKTGIYVPKTLSATEVLIMTAKAIEEQEQRITAIEDNVSSLTGTVDNVQQTVTEVQTATQEISQRLEREIKSASAYDTMLDADHAKTKEKVRNLEGEVLDIKDQLVDITSLPKTMWPDIKGCVSTMINNLDKYQGLTERQARQQATEDILGDISVEAGHTRSYISQERNRRRGSLMKQGISEASAKKRITYNTVIDTDPALKIAAAKVIQSYNRTLAALENRLIL